MFHQTEHHNKNVKLQQQKIMYFQFHNNLSCVLLFWGFTIRQRRDIISMLIDVTASATQNQTSVNLKRIEWVPSHSFGAF